MEAHCHDPGTEELPHEHDLGIDLVGHSKLSGHTMISRATVDTITLCTERFELLLRVPILVDVRATLINRACLCFLEVLMPEDQSSHLLVNAPCTAAAGAIGTCHSDKRLPPLHLRDECLCQHTAPWHGI